MTCITRSRIVRIARAWVGTPYHHQASAFGVGTDCIGLVRGIFRELYGRDPETAPAYTRDWAEAAGCETLLKAARRHLLEIAPDAALPGDVLVFRYRTAMVAKHAGVMTGPAAMVHAMEGAPVTEVVISPWWRRRIAGAFAFPALDTLPGSAARASGSAQCRSGEPGP
jgi:NlpC/P60 family putative phage cell wall peptidase